MSGTKIMLEEARRYMRVCADRMLQPARLWVPTASDNLTEVNIPMSSGDASITEMLALLAAEFMSINSCEKAHESVIREISKLQATTTSSPTSRACSRMFERLDGDSD